MFVSNYFAVERIGEILFDTLGMKNVYRRRPARAVLRTPPYAFCISFGPQDASNKGLGSQNIADTSFLFSSHRPKNTTG